MDKPMVEFMQASGFEVVHSEVVGFVASIELGRVGPEHGLRARPPDRPAGGATPSSCRAAIGLRCRWSSGWSNELGKPVLANNAVSLWAGLRLLKRGDSIPGYGRLLRDHLAA